MSVRIRIPLGLSDLPTASLRIGMLKFTLPEQNIHTDNYHLVIVKEQPYLAFTFTTPNSLHTFQCTYSVEEAEQLIYKHMWAV